MQEVVAEIVPARPPSARWCVLGGRWGRPGHGPHSAGLTTSMPTRYASPSETTTCVLTDDLDGPTMRKPRSQWSRSLRATMSIRGGNCWDLGAIQVEGDQGQNRHPPTPCLQTPKPVLIYHHAQVSILNIAALEPNVQWEVNVPEASTCDGGPVVASPWLPQATTPHLLVGSKRFASPPNEVKPTCPSISRRPHRVCDGQRWVRH